MPEDRQAERPCASTGQTRGLPVLVFGEDNINAIKAVASRVVNKGDSFKLGW